MVCFCFNDVGQMGKESGVEQLCVKLDLCLAGHGGYRIF